MGELKVHPMTHLGFHRGAQKDKDKERGPPAKVPERHEKQESKKHEKLQKEFRSMIPGTPAASSSASVAPSQTASQAPSQAHSAAPTQPASRHASPIASPPGSAAGSRPGSPALSRASSFNSVVQPPPLGKHAEDGSVHAPVKAVRSNEPNVFVPYQGEHRPSGTLLYTAGTGKPPRLEVYDTGNGKRQHWHHLRPARRQEKLSRMLKDLFKREPHHDADGNTQEPSPASSRAGSPGPTPAQVTDSLERDRDAAEAVAIVSRPDQPPTLLAGIESQLQNSGRDPAEVLNELLSQRKVTDPTLVQRYGQLSSVVGKGSFGVVRLAQKADPYNKNRKLVYAVKEFHPNSGESESRYLKRLASEFCLASSLHNVNIIHTLDLLRDGKSKYCGVMEYCAGGDLYSLIVVAGKLEPLEADCFFKQIMRGVAYMHEMGVAHRDLKPENILLTSRGCCKLTDFGNAECFRMAWEKDVHMSTNIAGSGPYIAPEEYKKSEFDPRAVDVWAAGVIYMAMTTGRHLWREAKSADEFYSKYLEGRKGESGYEPIERLKMSKRRNVIYSVLDPVASRRLTARQVLNSEWGREIAVCEAGEGDILKP